MSDLQQELDEALETIQELESDLDNAREEIDVLQDDLDGAEGRVEDARKDGYEEALQDAKNAIANLE